MFFQSANAGFGIIADLVMVLGIARAAEKYVSLFDYVRYRSLNCSGKLTLRKEGQFYDSR